MKFASISALFFTALAITSTTFAMDENGWASTYESMAAFENRVGGDARIFNRPGYVAPIIENLGNVLNSNWYISASVPQSLTFEAGMPFSIIPIGNDDQTFTENGVSVPTIFGTHGDANYASIDPTVYGNKTLNGLGVFTYPYLQLGAGFYHARVVLRGMYLPSISNLKGFSVFGFGLQYSFGHFFQYMLPSAAQGLDVSLVYGHNSSSIGYQPDDYSGKMTLDVSTNFFAMVIGYKPINFIEVMMTLGYQGATMESSGEITCNAADNAYYGQSIRPNISVDGNNGFRFGLEVAFQLGSSFHPVVGFDYAGKSSFTTNVLYFRQQFGTDKTPAEIAKEKGANQSGESVKEDSAKTENDPNATVDESANSEENVPAAESAETGANSESEEEF